VFSLNESGLIDTCHDQLTTNTDVLFSIAPHYSDGTGIWLQASTPDSSADFATGNYNIII
jgi:hypothetical protein